MTETVRLTPAMRQARAEIAATGTGGAWRRNWHGATVAALLRAGEIEPVPGERDFVRVSTQDETTEEQAMDTYTRTMPDGTVTTIKPGDRVLSVGRNGGPGTVLSIAAAPIGATIATAMDSGETRYWPSMRMEPFGPYWIKETEIGPFCLTGDAPADEDEATCERCETSPATVDGMLCVDCDAYNTGRVVL